MLHHQVEKIGFLTIGKIYDRKFQPTSVCFSSSLLWTWYFYNRFYYDCVGAVEEDGASLPISTVLQINNYTTKQTIPGQE